jgi:hypothetical protein
MSEAKMTVRGKQVSYIRENDDRIRIDSADQIPDFETEAEEQAFWETHALSARFWREAEPAPEDRLPPVRRATKTRSTKQMPR